MPRLLQICPHDIAPFGALCERYREAAARIDAQVTTVYLAPPQALPRPQAQYLNIGDLGDTRAIIAALENTLEGEWDLVLCHRYRAYWAFVRSRLKARRTIALAHDYGMMARWQRRLNRRLFARDVVFAGVAADLAREVAAHVGQTPTVLPNVLAPAAVPLSREAARLRLGVEDDDAPLIGFVGRLHYKKRPSLALQAFQQFTENNPSARMVFVGGGEELERLQAQDVANVIFTGYLEDAPALYPAFDALLHTARKEAFGMVVLEAMAAGVAVVTMPAYGPADVLGELGFYAEREDAAAFAEALSRALDHDRGTLMREGAARVAASFSPEALAEVLSCELSAERSTERPPQNR